MDIYWPGFDDTFLADLSAALRIRRKALKYRSERLGCERLVEIEDGATAEKMELEIRLSGKTSVRVFAWSDRWLWVDARAATKKGWAWEWTHDGRLLGAFTGRNVVGAIEDTLDRIGGVGPQAVGELAEIWKKLLARGPEEVHFR